MPSYEDKTGGLGISDSIVWPSDFSQGWTGSNKCALCGNARLLLPAGKKKKELCGNVHLFSMNYPSQVTPMVEAVLQTSAQSKWLLPIRASGLVIKYCFS